MRKFDPILKVEDLRVGYRKKKILHGVSLNVAKSEIVGVIGANGAGKSTLLKAIFGFVQHQGGTVGGEIIFEDNNVTHLEPSKKVKSGMGYVLQGGEIFSNLSVEDNLSLAFRTRENVQLEKRRDFIYELFPRLHEFRKRRAGLLSGGQRQALAIGLVLMSEPKLLLMDEPTASLSLEAIESISDAIVKFKSEFNLAILLVEQNIDKCLSLSDRIYLMRDGKIIDMDFPANIIRENKLERLFGIKKEISKQLI